MPNHSSNRPPPRKMGAPASPTVGPFLSPRQIADRLGVSRRTVDRYIARGELRASRFGKLVRVAESEVLTFIRRHQIGPV